MASVDIHDRRLMPHFSHSMRKMGPSFINWIIFVDECILRRNSLHRTSSLVRHTIGGVPCTNFFPSRSQLSC